MTPDEKAAQMLARNAAICAYYTAGHNVRECASQFRIGKQRILQILKKADVWVPYSKSDRTKFLGVNVSEQTRDALKKKAADEGVSVSRLTSDALDKMVVE